MYKLIQKEKLSQGELITKISQNIFIIYNDFNIYYYEYDQIENKFLNTDFYPIYFISSIFNIWKILVGCRLF